MKNEIANKTNKTTTKQVTVNKIVFNVTSIFAGDKNLKTILTERVIEKALETANF